jgi:hypothetical protein
MVSSESSSSLQLCYPASREGQGEIHCYVAHTLRDENGIQTKLLRTEAKQAKDAEFDGSVRL